MKKVKKDIKGITLIALVVTIIVLLILASVAISLTIGSNGIFTRAENAVDRYEIAAKDEQDEMNKAVDFMDQYMNGEKEDEEVKVEGVKVPKGFYYVGGTKADGIVISDSKEDENKYKAQTDEGNSQIPGDGLVGNQFVWVPVDNPTDFRRYSSYYNNGKTQSISSYYEPSEEGYRYPNEVEEYNSMKQSVEINKGFYVARYEAGKEKIEGVDTVVSKKNAKVWNSIPWGNSMTDIGSTGAVAKAQGMYTDKSKYDVTSTLIYGVQWDAIMAWIDPAYKTSSCADDSFVKNSEGKGNYSDSDSTNNPAKCGSSDNYRVNNIYDLAGNVFEWTMEAYSTNIRVTRGGGYNYSGSNGPASDRSYGGPDGPGTYERFPCRFILVGLNAKAADFK